MSLLDGLVIFVGGIVAGVVNAMAGGGSLLTVPLLSLAGVSGLDANGTNRVAVLIQTVASGVGYHQSGVRPYRETVRMAPPALAGGLAGALVVSSIDDDLFERVFGLLMIPLLVLALWKPKTDAGSTTWSWPVVAAVFFAVGFYAGAIQAGVGILLLLVLTRAGFDLVVGNAIKTLLVILVTAIVALPVFIAKGQVEWLPARVLSGGSGIGGYLGARAAATRGEKIVKPVLIVSVVALSGRMIGIW